MNDKVIVFTGHEDPMWPFLLDACSSEERKNLLLFQTNQPRVCQCSINPSDNILYLLIEQKIFTQKDIRGIWWRRVVPPDLSFLEKDMRMYCEDEFADFMRGIESLLPNIKWVSKPSAIDLARNKVLQQIIAKELGLEVVDGIFTNSPFYARKFIEGGETVYKTIKTPRVPMDSENFTTAFTTLIDKALESKIDGLMSCPGIIQRFVDKQADIRVSVFDNQVFAVKIESQQCDAARVDFRMGARYVQHIPHELPNDIASQCVELLRRLNLKFGAIDLGLMKDGKYVFFEINPNGQWGWLEEKTGMPMRRALLDFLFA